MLTVQQLFSSVEGGKPGCTEEFGFYVTQFEEAPIAAVQETISVSGAFPTSFSVTYMDVFN